jgi:hypothetical protein
MYINLDGYGALLLCLNLNECMLELKCKCEPCLFIRILLIYLASVCNCHPGAWLCANTSHNFLTTVLAISLFAKMGTFFKKGIGDHQKVQVSSAYASHQWLLDN